MSAAWMTNQLVRMADGRKAMPLEIPRYNPRPPGVLLEGSASSAILDYLKAHPGRYFTEGDLIRGTNRTRASITWSLHYLAGLKLIAVVGGGHHSRYNRYRMVSK